MNTVDLRRCAVRRNQRGISLVSLILAGIIIIALVYVGAQSIPILNEYFIVRRIANTVKDEATVESARSAFRRQLQVETAYSFNPDTDLKFSKVGNGVRIVCDYERDIPLFGPLYLVFRFDCDIAPKPLKA